MRLFLIAVPPTLRLSDEGGFVFENGGAVEESQTALAQIFEGLLDCEVQLSEVTDQVRDYAESQELVLKWKK